MSQINIGDLTIDKFYLGDSSDVKIYLGEIKLYPSDEPQPSVRYAVTDDISTYQDTTYLDVYNMLDDSWYKKNNLNEYEEYGVYGESTASTETYYNGKLAIVDGYEYKYANNQWNNIGEVIMEYVPMTTGFSSSQVLETIRLDISGTTSSCYIYLSNVPDTTETYSNWYIRIRGTSSQIYYTTDGTNRTSIRVTACTLVSGTTYEFTFPYPMYFNAAYPYSSMEISGMPLVASAMTESVLEKYVDVPQPDFYMIYDTVSDMEDETDIYVGKYGQVGNTIYKYNETSGWTVTADKLMTGTTVSNIRSSQLYFNAYYSGAEKFYVNGSQTDGVHNWVFHNENPFSAISFNTSVTDAGLVSFDFLTLDTSQYTTVTGNIVYGNMSSIKEVNIPPSVTAITNSCIGVHGSDCPLRINMLMTSDLTTCYDYWDGVSDEHVYIPNGIILGQWTPIPNIQSKITIHVPSSAVTRYRSDTYAKTYIPFIELLDNGTADLSYSYYIRNYNNGHNYTINYTDTVLTGSSITNNDGWSSLYFGSNITSIANNAFRNTNTTKTIPRIVKLKFENGLTSIGEYAFYKGNLGNLIDMPNYEYINCEKYGYIEIPDSVTTIGKYAFHRGYTSIYSGKERIVIGSGITSIGDYAFGISGRFINVDNEITCKALTPPTLGTNVFYDGTTNYISAIYVPSESLEAYKSSWSQYASKIEAIPTTLTLQWEQYYLGDTVPSKLFYGVKLGDPSMDTTSIEFGDAFNTDFAFIFDINSEYGWYAQDISGEQIDISEYYDETERCYVIYFSDLGLGAMPLYYPAPNESFEFDVQLYQEVTLTSN